jgi:hypothetical protein
VRAATSLEARDALSGKGLVTGEEVAILLCKDVVGYHGNVVRVTEVAAHGEDQGRLAAVRSKPFRSCGSNDKKVCSHGLRNCKKENLAMMLFDVHGHGIGAYLPTGPPMPMVKERCLKSRLVPAATRA